MEEPRRGNGELCLGCYLQLLSFSGAHFSPPTTLPEFSLGTQTPILSLHSLNHFPGSRGTFFPPHPKRFRIPLVFIFSASTLHGPTHLTLPAPPFPGTICSFPEHYLLPCLCAHSSLCLELPFPPGASSDSIHSTQLTGTPRDQLCTSLCSSLGRLEKIATN